GYGAGTGQLRGAGEGNCPGPWCQWPQPDGPSQTAPNTRQTYRTFFCPLPGTPVPAIAIITHGCTTLCRLPWLQPGVICVCAETRRPSLPGTNRRWASHLRRDRAWQKLRGPRHHAMDAATLLGVPAAWPKTRSALALATVAPGPWQGGRSATH